MPSAPPPDISEFNFGATERFVLPKDEPSPQLWLVYTAWQVWRVLRNHRKDHKAGRHNKTVPPVFQAFKEDLTVVRAIQPFRRVKKGKVEYVRIPDPVKPRHRAAILLYALLPGTEEEQCSCCMRYYGSGPFAQCIAGRAGDRWTGGACLNCYYTGTMHKCELRKKRELAQRRDLIAKGQIPWEPAAGAEKVAEVEDIEAMLRLVRAEKERRRIKRRRVLGTT